MKIRPDGWTSRRRVLLLLVLALQGAGTVASLVHRALHAVEAGGATEVAAACPRDCGTDGHEHDDGDHGSCAACKVGGATCARSDVQASSEPAPRTTRLWSGRQVVAGLHARATTRVRGPPLSSATQQS